MAFFSFYNVRRPRQFEHKPIYWDPRKEDLEERTRRIKRELGVEIPEEEYKPSIKGTFIEGTTHLKKNRTKGHDARSRQYSNIRLIVILVILATLFWVFFLK
ncbi:MAG: hypothetical protein LBQ78_03120 [Tannerellaceae bacterium]|jgi:hypothetical protein|nr:hypothetical protein [Tannerellaceae bacterium]